MNGVADVEPGNIDHKLVGQIARETFDRQRAQTLLEQAAEIFHPIRRPDRFQRHIGVNGLVHRDGVKIEVQNVASNGGMLDFLHHRHAVRFFAVDLELDENIFARGMAQHRAHVASGNLQRLRLLFPAVDDRRHDVARLKFAHGRAAGVFSPLRFEFNLSSHCLPPRC